MIYSIDFETRSRIDLTERGLDIYANDPTTEVLCIAWGTSPDNVVVCKGNSIVQNIELIDHVKSGGKIQAWNAVFEYSIWNCVCVPKYGWPPLKLEQCIDSMAIAAANNIPQSLDEAGDFLATDYKKDGIGKKLIQKLCKPTIKGDFNNDPTLLKQLFDYCAQDVRTEMSIVANLRPLTEYEQRVWEVTQRINLSGVPVCPKELQNAVYAVERAQEAINAECLELTGCRPSERAKLLAWLQDRGANLDDLTSESVSAMLLKNNTLDPDIKRALEYRQQGSLTSLAKYKKMLEIQRGGRIRNTLVYSGANTGRWASRGGLNAQNFARPTVEVTEELIERVLVRGEGATTEELSSLVRSALKASEGKVFVSVDYSSIENRTLAWLAGQQDKLELFKNGGDEYLAFASNSLYRIPLDQVTKDQRQIAKAAVLGNGFGQGAKGFKKYAEGFGLELTEAESKKIVDAYRAEYSRVKASWSSFETAAISAIKNPGQAYPVGKIMFKVGKGALWLRLPSGRLIAWQSPELQLQPTPWGSMKSVITVRNQSTYTRQWGRNTLIGSSIVQSATQAVARDLLAHSVIRLCDETDAVINMLIHDEVLCEVKEEDAEAMLSKIIDIMCQGPAWSEGLPIDAEGYISQRYKK